MPLGALSITYAAIDGMYSLTTAVELSSVDDGMTNYRECDKCGRRDNCPGTSCEMAAPRDQEGAD